MDRCQSLYESLKMGYVLEVGTRLGCNWEDGMTRVGEVLEVSRYLAWRALAWHCFSLPVLSWFAFLFRFSDLLNAQVLFLPWKCFVKRPSLTVAKRVLRRRILANYHEDVAPKH